MRRRTLPFQVAARCFMEPPVETERRHGSFCNSGCGAAAPRFFPPQRCCLRSYFIDPPSRVVALCLLRTCGDVESAYAFLMSGDSKAKWGGRRVGAGRKPSAASARISHAKRARHFASHPLHVTLRVVAGLPSLRKRKHLQVVKRAFLLAKTAGKHREDFRITHFSVQGNHVHLVTEATNETHLARGVQGLAVRIARRLNRALDRRGRIFSRRYFARALKTPRDVRNVLAYVLLNEQRHLYKARRLSLPPWYYDPCSSAAEFDGWLALSGLDPPPLAPREVTVPARSDLLRSLWRRCGLIATDEIPGRNHVVTQ
ncbi:MAG: hypothetical protein EOO73_27190 [Myxococcales bacterium]|nr:MAG: hypothetical protein EOO73_27190 [Myxococcales bacterium]